MPVVPLKEILDRALAERYGVPAINIFNDLTLEAVLAAAVERRSPVIVQTSVKTVRSIGLDVLYGMWETMTAGIEVPVTLHLDHCPEREVITDCLRKGWNSVLFDASRLPVEENLRQTIEVVAEARAVRRPRRGRDRGDHRRRGRHRLRRRGASGSPSRSRSTSSSAPASTCFAPSIGNAHGVYIAEPDARRPAGHRPRRGHRRYPIALHGGTGLTDDAVQRPDRPRLREGEHLHRRSR